MAFLHDGTYVVCGMERSGSTYAYQVLKALGLNARKSHSYELGAVGSVKIYTYRDPRDIICSYARTKLQAEISSGELSKTAPGCPREDLRAACYRLFYRPNARQLDYRIYMWEADQGAPVVFIKYEDYFLGNEKALVTQLCDFVSRFENLNVSESKIDEILEDCSMEANAARSREFESFEEWDEATGIHGNHISANGKSTWREEFDFTIAVCVDRFLGDFLIELEYEKDHAWIEQFAENS
ncbi:MAG TPA: hypothetical protein EYQ00_10125 [Dehalococcoidia bacterium]|nr:hypothetical protein [Dehalococcoidia bacterium]